MKMKKKFKEEYLKGKLKKVKKIKREKHDKKLHEIHKKHHVSKKTLFYLKEYGGKTNVSKRIIKESLKILIITSILSSFGGFALERIKVLFLAITPLVILLPALNDMVGNCSIIISSRFSEMLHEGKVQKKIMKTKEVKKLFFQILTVSFIAAILSSTIALIISHFSEGGMNLIFILKIFFIVIFDMLFLTTLLFFIVIFLGVRIYNKNEDPNNFLIPISTGIADFANMVLLMILILLLF